jgi:hypothetical protein
MQDKTIYFKEIIKQVPRILGQLDRNPLSKTYGCFDRQYWHYNIVDFPCVRYQEAVLTLSIAYQLKNKENPYYNNALLRDWINAAVEFWAKIQDKDGSFSEWYPHEHSFAPTAFSAYAISETLLRLNKDIIHKDKTIKSLEKAASWLLTKKEERVQNQECGAVIALHNIFLLTKKELYKKRAEEIVKRIAKKQSDEGWFYEYGSADIGYLSLAIDYLAKYHKKTKNKIALAMLNKAIDFISYFIHPNLTVGGEYASRNTEYLIPDGFEIMAAKNKAAATITSHIRASLKNQSTISPFSLDDRYLCYIGYTWLQAFENSKNKGEKAAPNYKKNFIKHFPEAKIYIISSSNFYAIINYGKGGTFKLFAKKNNKCLYDAGTLIKTKTENLMSALVNTSKAQIKNQEIVIEGSLGKIQENILSPAKNISLRLFQSTLGKSSSISLAVKNKLRDLTITKKDVRLNMRYKRKISISQKVKIEDTISAKEIVKKVVIGAKASYIFVPSSRYFQLSELNNQPKEFMINSKQCTIAREFDASGKVKIKKRV